MAAFRKTGAWAMRGYDLVVDGMFYFAAALLMFLAAAVGYSVIMRRFFDNPIGWVFDTAGYMLFFIAFLSGARILKENGHARMTLVLERVGPKTVLWLNGITSIAGATICAVAIWYTGDAVIDAIRENQIYREINFPIHRAILWWIMPAGFFAMAVQFIRMSIGNWGQLFHWSETSARSDERSTGAA